MKPQDQSAIVDVLQQNMVVADELRTAGQELEVVNVVLATPARADATGADKRAAVDRLPVIEKKLADAAHTLDESNERLKDIALPSS